MSETPATTAEAARGPVVLVYSAHAGNARALESLESLLAEAGVVVRSRLPVDALDLHRPEGARWRAEGFRAVIAAGGDGTIGAVASHVAGSGLPMGILPMGTANDVARSLYLPMDLGDAARALAEGLPTRIDAGQVAPAMTEPGALSARPGGARGRRRRAPTADAPTPAVGAYFLHAMTLGLNVEFARLATDVAQRQRWGKLTYAASVLDALTHYAPVPVTLELMGVPGNGRSRTISCRAVQVVALNTPVLFGAALGLRVPDVDLNDRLLDILVLEALEPAHLRQTVEGLLGAVGRFAESLRGANGAADAEASDESLGLAWPGVRRLKARAMTLLTQQPVDVTLDGEIRAHTPIVVRATESAVLVLLPTEARQRLGLPADASAAAGETADAPDAPYAVKREE